MELTTYKVTFKETADEWIFQYRQSDGVLYSLTNLKGSRIMALLAKAQVPSTIAQMEEWKKYRQIVTIELMLEDYSFEAFWNAYNHKIKREPARKAFEKMKLEEKIQAFAKLREYDAFLARTGQAKAHLVTWINQRRFEDEY